jgi:NADH:ubiquinone oxidoreductase subunit 6 (subunit J)
LVSLIAVAASSLLSILTVVENICKPGLHQSTLASEPSPINMIVGAINHKFSDILVFAELLYRQHSALFMITTLLLLSAMIGAIVLAANSTEYSTAPSSVDENR